MRVIYVKEELKVIYAVCSPHVAAWVVPGGSTFYNKCGLYLYSLLGYFLLGLSLLAFSAGEAEKKRFLSELICFMDG